MTSLMRFARRSQLVRRLSSERQPNDDKFEKLFDTVLTKVMEGNKQNLAALQDLHARSRPDSWDFTTKVLVLCGVGSVTYMAGYLEGWFDSKEHWSRRHSKQLSDSNKQDASIN